MKYSAIAQPQFSLYTYSAALAAGATFVPPVNTILQTMHLGGAAQDLQLMMGGGIYISGLEQEATSTGFIGTIHCDGGSLGCKNLNVAQKTLVLRGLTMA